MFRVKKSNNALPVPLQVCDYFWLTFIWPNAMLILPDLHLPKQNRADIGTIK